MTNPDHVNNVLSETIKEFGKIDILFNNSGATWGTPLEDSKKMAKAVLEESEEAILAQTPLNQFGSDDDLKGASVFLASNASAYVTGAIIMVDGGYSAM